MSRGRFITFEGGEGAGKTTQLRLLGETWQSLGQRVILTREPGGSPGAEEIRRLLVSGAAGRWDGMSELLLHVAARRDHLVRTVWPAMADGVWVLCDRFSDSTLAYQGHGHGLPLHAIEQLHDLAIGGFTPDLTIILDLPVEEGLRRAGLRGDGENRYEQMGWDFHQRLRQGYLEIARHDPQRCMVVSALDDVETVRQRIWQQVATRMR